jgi:hypothetical protein
MKKEGECVIEARNQLNAYFNQAGEDVQEQQYNTRFLVFLPLTAGVMVSSSPSLDHLALIQETLVRR